MKTLEIDMPEDIYYKAIKEAETMNITFDEYCSLGIQHLFEDHFGGKRPNQAKATFNKENPSQTKSN